jgi:hypothetical protein
MVFESSFSCENAAETTEPLYHRGLNPTESDTNLTNDVNYS